MLTFNSENYNQINQYDDIERYTTIINALSTLLRFNRKYDIILVPSSINLDKKFLLFECQLIAPHHEAISEWRISFLYKGNLYRFDEYKHQQRFNNNDNNINYEQQEEEEKIFMDEVKVVLRHLHDNIKNDEIDSLDPKMDIFDDNDDDDDNNNHNIRLRGKIKRTSCDKIFRWLNIGCGACFLQESNGKTIEIGPPQNKDYEMKFPLELQKSIFENYIDCKIPYNIDIITQDKKCSICRDLQIKPSSIGNNQCNHTFCQRCIQQWNQMRKSKIEHDEYRYNDNNNNNINNHNNNNNNNDNNRNYPKCPLCQRKINKISIDKQKEIEMKENIPATIYQQILDENEGRYQRLHAIDLYYHQQRQQQFYEIAEKNEPLQTHYDNNPETAYLDAGYGPYNS